MMLRRSELQALLDFTERIAFLTDADQLHDMLAGLAALTGADVATLTSIDLRSGREMAMIWPKPGVISQGFVESVTVRGSHPLHSLLVDQARSNDRHPAAMRISDVMSIRQWRNRGLPSSSHAGVDDQMCLLLSTRESALQILLLSRCRGQFTDRQAALLTAGHGHLSAAVRRSGRQPLPLLQLVPQLRWVMAPIAIQTRYRSGDFRDRSIDGVDGAEGPNSTEPGDPVNGAPVGSGAPPTNLETVRQRQILALAAEGMTDAQIGRRLALSSATVSKHLSRAYTRLGVPNRAAAVRLLGAGAVPAGHRPSSAVS
ncbi:MAG: helix-turn-helix transcriptional regulator [Nakamurella sp.]